MKPPIEHIDTYDYAGQGAVFISGLGNDLLPIGFGELGKLSGATIFVKNNQLTHTSSRHSAEVLDAAITRAPTVTVTLKGSHLDYDVLSKFVGGVVTRTEEGVTTEALPYPVSAGMIYPLNYTGSSDVVITNLVGDITYIVGVNYMIYGSGNSFKVLPEQEQIDAGATDVLNNLQVEVSYTHEANIELAATMVPVDPVALRFEGLNTAQDNIPVVVELPRVVPQFLTSLALVTYRTGEWEITSIVLPSDPIIKGSDFFRQKTVELP